MPENILKFSKPGADFFVPDGIGQVDALKRVTHLGVGAHQDDLEIMALDGILKCFDSSSAWFGGITCTSGSGSVRAGKYADYSDAEMARVRREEQRAAATIGQYGAMIQLGFQSAEVRGQEQNQLVQDLVCVLNHCAPEVVYTHNPADRHTTHLAVFWATLKAIRKLPRERRPKFFYGCEGWRDLDWMPDNSKIAFDVGKDLTLVQKLIDVYDSQIGGGKNYADAIMGRFAANATFSDPYSVDRATHISKAMDLAPLIEDDREDVILYVSKFIDEFKNEEIVNLTRSNTGSK